MKKSDVFSFERGRGIVWVCDVAGSSSRLNSDDGATDTEAFLPRLHWVANVFVNSAGGTFIKWTGDGFLAWFPVALHRDLERTALRCYEALWHLTSLVNLTQLALTPHQPFALRHAITFEQDALLTRIAHGGDTSPSLDMLGRSVVLAFRLSSVRAAFPGLATTRDIVEALHSDVTAHFKKWTPTKEDLLRYFKGERLGTRTLFVSTTLSGGRMSRQKMLKMTDDAIKRAEGAVATPEAKLAFVNELLRRLAEGPDWAQSLEGKYLEAIRADLKILKETVQEIKDLDGHSD